MNDVWPFAYYLEINFRQDVIYYAYNNARILIDINIFLFQVISRQMMIVFSINDAVP